LASVCEEVKKSMMPFMTQLEFDSPGCTRAEMNTPFFGCVVFDTSFDVMVIISHRLPANVLVNSWR
jgi:hypothetical protein